MEARVLIRYFLLVHLAFTLINGHPLLDSLFMLGDDTVRIDLRVTKDQKDTKETHFLLTTILDVEDLRDVVKIIAEKHRHKMDVGYTTYIHQLNFSSSENYVDMNDQDLVPNFTRSQLPQEQIERLRKNDRTWKNNSTGHSYQDVNSDKRKNSSSSFSYLHGLFLNTNNGRPRKGENSDKIQYVMRDEPRRSQIILIDQIYDIIRDALSLVKKRTGMKKKVVENFLDVIEEDSTRHLGDDEKDVQDRLLNLYADARILHQALLKDSVLRNGHKGMSFNDRASSYDYWSRPRLRLKNDSSDRYYLQNFLDWLTRNQTHDNSTVHDVTVGKNIFENINENITQLKNDTTDTLEVDPVKSANEKLVNRMYKQDVVANETAVRFGFDHLWNLSINQLDKKSHLNNLSSITNHTLISEGHSSHQLNDSEDHATSLTELGNNIKNVSVTRDNKNSKGNAIMKNVSEDATKFLKDTTETSDTEITKVEDTKDSNVKNVSYPTLPKINGTVDESDVMKNTTIIHIKDRSKNVIRNLTITNEFLEARNPSVATTNTKRNTSFLIENEKSKENSEENQFVMDHILDAVDKVLLFD